MHAFLVYNCNFNYEFHVCSNIPSIFANCTQLHLFVNFTYFDVSRHSEHFCQLHPNAPNCTFLWFSHFSTFHVILSIFINCIKLLPIAPNCTCHAPSEGYK